MDEEYGKEEPRKIGSKIQDTNRINKKSCVQLQDAGCTKVLYNG